MECSGQIVQQSVSCEFGDYPGLRPVQFHQHESKYSTNYPKINKHVQCINSRSFDFASYLLLLVLSMI